MKDHELDVDIADLLAGDEDDSQALADWKDRLSEYVDRQGALDALRLRAPTEPPWPAPDNPMIGYLRERSEEIVAEDGLGAAVGVDREECVVRGRPFGTARIVRLIDED